MPELEPNPWSAPREHHSPNHRETEPADSDVRTIDSLEDLEDTIPLPAYRPERLIM